MQKITGPRESRLHEVGSKDRVYHPKRAVVRGSVTLMIVCGILLAFCFVLPFQSGVLVGLKVFVGFLCLFFLASALYFYTNTLIFTEYGITERSLFGAKQIPFDRVTAITSREFGKDNTSFNVTTVEGDGKRIVFGSQMDDYDLLVDHVLCHVDTEAGEWQ